VNNSITKLEFHESDVLRLNNVERCGRALMKNKKMIELEVHDGCDKESCNCGTRRVMKDAGAIRSKLEELAKHRTPYYWR